MSVQAMAWVLQHSKAEGSERLVLLAIANHADGAGQVAWPRVELLAEEAKVSRRTVFRALESLVLLGEIEIQSGRGRGMTNTYTLKGVTGGTPQQALKGDTHGTPGVPPMAQGCANGGTQNHKEPSLNQARARGKGATVTPLTAGTHEPRTDVVYDPDSLVMDEKGRWFVQ